MKSCFAYILWLKNINNYKSKIVYILEDFLAWWLEVEAKNNQEILVNQESHWA